MNVKKKTIELILTLVVGPIVGFIRNRLTTFDHELVIGAIFKDEATYLDEWLTFHRGVGVDHFYMYNNFSSDDYLSVLKPWIESGWVTLIDWPMKAGQIHAYADCIKKFKNKTRWMVFIDIDEFLFSPKTRDIRTVLREYTDLAGIFVFWILFGSSGHVSRPPGSVIEAYTKRLDDHTADTEKAMRGVSARAQQGKTIFNPRLIRIVDHHMPVPWWGQILDEGRNLPPRHAKTRKVAFSVLRVNHYWSKSIEEFHEKVARGRPKTGEDYVLEDFLKREKTLNIEDDFTILPIWQEIKSLSENWSWKRGETK